MAGSAHKVPRPRGPALGQQVSMHAPHHRAKDNVLGSVSRARNQALAPTLTTASNAAPSPASNPILSPAARPVAQPTAKPATRAALHRETRESAAAIPVPLFAPKPAPEPPATADLRSVTSTGSITLRDLEIPELMWLQEMRNHLHHPADPGPTAAELSARFDEFCAAWHNHSRNHRWDPTYAKASLGVGLGDLLIAQSPTARWVLTNPDDGPRYGVRDENLRVTFLPLDAVARRWDQHQLGWVTDFLTQAAEEL